MRQLLRAAVIGLVLSVAAWPPTAEAVYSKTQLPLTGCRGYHSARGIVTYTNSLREKDIPDGQRVVIVIENVALPPGTELLVYVHENEVGTIKLDKRRGGRLVIEPTFRQPAPAITTSSFVVLKLIDGTTVMW
ncbi:MAG: hypothetical protein H7062_04435 [Candidatus Saccharimonas sp.]|nr:hypothetical protein [Planctomycetaceae bacterium]